MFFNPLGAGVYKQILNSEIGGIHVRLKLPTCRSIVACSGASVCYVHVFTFHFFIFFDENTHLEVLSSLNHEMENIMSSWLFVLLVDRALV